MTSLYIAASIVLVLTGAVHSIIGELMIFRKLSKESIVPNQSAPPLSLRNIRILWASWHALTVFGLALTGILFKAGNNELPNLAWLSNAIAAACLAGGLLVLVGTKARHPGWIALTLAAVLIWLALRASATV
jgi:hypothetical protein